MPATPPDPRQSHLDQLRRHRVWREKDTSLGFLKDQFQKQVARPHKQLQSLVELWQELVPPELAVHTRLVSLNRGTLHVAADSSARVYELDRLLRGGLQQELITRHRGPAFRKVQIRLCEPLKPGS